MTFPIDIGRKVGRPARGVLRLLAMPLLVVAFSSAAQVQEAWVNRYNGGLTNLDHRPVALALDASGNVYVAGSSQTTSSNYDYVVLKYASDGTQAWAARYAPPTGGTNTVAALALDQGGNACVTGTAGTVKIGAGGALAWAAPYAGTSLATDTNGNVYVTGFSTSEFATVKLDAGGSNVWLGTFNSHPGYPAASQRVGVDQAGNLYVAGWAMMARWVPPVYYTSPWLVRYDPAGAQAWAHQCLADYDGLEISIRGLLFDSSGNVYVTGNGADPAETAKVSPSGQELWFSDYGWWPGVSAMVLDGMGNVYLTSSTYVTVKIDSGTGSVAWGSDLWFVDQGYIASSGIALDLDPA